MLVKGNEIILNNGDYFAKYCFKQDLCRIYRMWLNHLDRTIGRDATRDEKELEYDRWLHKTFSQSEWDAAKIKETDEHWW